LPNPDNRPSEVSVPISGNAITIESSRGTTSFVDTADTQVVEARPNVAMGSLGPDPHDANSIANFLAKPIEVFSYTISPSDVRNTDLYHTSLLASLLAQPMWAQKLRGYNLLRATAVVTVIVNANPFQAGRLQLSFIPMSDQCQAYSSNFLATNTINYTRNSQYPNVEMDLKEASMTLKIPYITPYSYANVSDISTDWGVVFLRVASPLATGAAGETALELSVFLSYEDLELAAPSYMPESGYVPSSRSQKIATSNDPLKEEANSTASTGVVSATMRKVSKTARLLGSVPVVGAFMPQVSSIAETGAKIASLWGWSKPLSTNTIQPVIDHPGRFLNTCDGVAMSDSLMLNPYPMIEPQPGIDGMPQDEMSFAYIKSRPAFLEAFNIVTSQVSGTQVYTKEIRPDALFVTETLTNSLMSFICVQHTPVSYFSEFFHHWRGSVVFTLKFVKTNFHSGRIAICYNPQGTLATTAEQQAYTLRDIVDIRSMDEYTFTVPWMKEVNYNLIGEKNGVLSISIVNELRCPETVSQAIEVMVYVSGGPDFEYAAPISTNRILFAAESGIGDSVVAQPTGTQNETSQADLFLSVKQLVSSARLWRFNQDPTPVSYRFYPFTVNAGTMDDSPIPRIGILATDLMSYILPCYRFSRGGMRIACVSTAADKIGKVALIPRGDNTVTYSAASDFFHQLFSFPQMQNTNQVYRRSEALPVDVICPHSSRAPLRLNLINYSGDDRRPVDKSAPDYDVVVETPVPNSFITRSGADDFSLHYFVGVPLLLSSVFLTP
jgi:hypothetical protein